MHFVSIVILKTAHIVFSIGSHYFFQLFYSWRNQETRSGKGKTIPVWAYKVGQNNAVDWYVAFYPSAAHPDVVQKFTYGTSSRAANAKRYISKYFLQW